MLLWAHEQLVQAEAGAAMPPQRHRPAGDAPKGSLLAQQGFKQRPALLTADTNIGEHAHQRMCPCAFASPGPAR